MSEIPGVNPYCALDDQIAEVKLEISMRERMLFKYPDQQDVWRKKITNMRAVLTTLEQVKFYHHPTLL